MGGRISNFRSQKQLSYLCHSPFLLLVFPAMNSLLFNPAIERYISLATYRRNGAKVLTPVWLAGAGEHFYLLIDVHARIVAKLKIIERAYAALRTKYGWQMALLDFFSGLSGKKQKRAVIELKAA